MQVRTVQEQRRYNLIQVLLVMLDKFNVQKPFVHLLWPFKERVVLRWRVHDVDDGEYSDVEQYQEAFWMHFA